MVIPDEAVVADVPVPDADLSRLRGQRQTFGELPQILILLLALGDVGNEAVPEHGTVLLPLRHRVAVELPDRAVGKLDPKLVLPRGQVLGRFLDGLDDAVAVGRVEVRENLGGVLADLLGRDPVDVADGLAGKGEAGGPVGAQAVLVDDSGNTARDFQEAAQQLFAVLFCLLDFVDVEAGPGEAEKTSIRREPGNAMILEPAEFPVSTAQAILHLEFPLRLIGQPVGARAGLQVVRVDVIRPAIAEFLLQLAPGEVEPRLVDITAPRVLVRFPKKHWRGICHPAETPLALLQ